MKKALLAFCWVALPTLAASTPFIFRGGVVNAASFVSNETPGGGIAQGSIFTIFGRGIGPATPTQVSSFPLTRQLAGVSINLRQGTTQLAAIPIFVIDSQINAILPSATPLGDVSLQVSFNDQTSNWVPVRVVEHAPGIFTATGSGRGWAIFQNFVTQSNQPLNSGTDAASPGQAGTLWLTGSGAIAGADGDTPPVGDLPYNIEVFIGGQAVSRKLYAGRAPAISGLDQYVFFVPDDAPTGCFVPVYVRVNGVVSNSTTMAIVPSGGGACSDAHNPIATSLIQGGRIVDAILSRGTLRAGQFMGIDIDLTADKASMRAMQEKGGQFAFDPFLSLPPRGTCTSYTLKGNPVVNGFLAATAGRALDLGTLSVSAGDASQPVAALQPGIYDATLGGGYPPSPPFFDAGALAVRASGGADGQAFSVAVGTGASLSGANLEQLTTLDRAAGANVEWAGQTNTSAIIVATNYDQPSDASGLVLCVSALGASNLQIPDYVTANLPATRDSADQSEGHVFFGALPVLTLTTTADQVRVFTARQDVLAVGISSIR